MARKRPEPGDWNTLSSTPGGEPEFCDLLSRHMDKEPGPAPSARPIRDTGVART